jgi:hypothetical protein
LDLHQQLQNTTPSLMIQALQLSMLKAELSLPAARVQGLHSHPALQRIPFCASPVGLLLLLLL